MADIQEKILDKYGVDLARENILKLYKIEKADLTAQELQALFDAARKRWNQSINGANEKNAERDRARLEKADKYEAILKDPKLFQAVYAYYNQSGGKGSGGKADASPGGGGQTEFAREFFKLVETSKKLKKDDVNFFFDYFQSERKNKKAILEMLEKEFKVFGLKKGDDADAAGEEEEVDKEGKKKKSSSPLIVNLFQEATILKLRKCADFYEKAAQSKEVCARYPALNDGLYEFLELKKITSISQFTEMVAARAKEVYAVRQEKGTEYVPLVDLFNTLQSLLEYRDVVDNLPEFKLMLRYPKLTPYMYEFAEMKMATLKGIYDIAKEEYSFRDDTDFLLSYFIPIHDNFGISDGAISALIKKAQKKEKQNRLRNEIDEKLGRKTSKKLSVEAGVIHFLVYWPIYLLYSIFEVFKFVFTKLHHFTIPLFLGLFVGSNWLFPKVAGMDNLLVLGRIFSRDQWYAYLKEFMGVEILNGWEGLAISLFVILLLLAIYVLPSLFVALFVHNFCVDLNERFDWIGLERTFQEILNRLKQRTQEQYRENQKLFKKKRIPKIIANIVCLVVLIALMIAAPIGVRTLSEKTGYFQPPDPAQQQTTVTPSPSPQPESVEASVSEETVEESAEEEILMVFTEPGTSNIRAGAGTNYDIISHAEHGALFVWTGNEVTAPNGGVWYEIYLNEEKTETGWASKTVISFQE